MEEYIGLDDYLSSIGMQIINNDMKIVRVARDAKEALEQINAIDDFYKNKRPRVKETLKDVYDLMKRGS